MQQRPESVSGSTYTYDMLATRDYATNLCKSYASSNELVHKGYVGTAVYRCNPDAMA
jgi:hypothetical protein